MSFKIDDPIKETMERIKKEKEESDLLDAEIDWGSYLGLNENATQEEIDQACEDQL